MAEWFLAPNSVVPVVSGDFSIDWIFVAWPKTTSRDQVMPFSHIPDWITSVVTIFNHVTGMFSLIYVKNTALRIFLPVVPGITNDTMLAWEKTSNESVVIGKCFRRIGRLHEFGSGSALAQSIDCRNKLGTSQVIFAESIS